MKRFLWTWCGCGFSPIAPGTAGTAGALAAAGLLLLLPAGWQTQVALAAGLIAATALSIALGPAAERARGKKDPGEFVIDEVAGAWLTLLGQPIHDRPVLVFVGAFFLFRLTDIAKPWPARRLESLPGGWGITLDDLVAAVYANLLLRGLLAVV